MGRDAGGMASSGALMTAKACIGVMVAASAAAAVE
jgi:hypothetical protein